MIHNLYLIGNGFDCHHDICSSYYAYLEWLKANKPNVYNEILEYYPEAKSEKWWGDFENRLGEIDLIPLIEQISLENQPDEDDYIRDHYIDNDAGAKDINNYLGKLISDIKATFNCWIVSLPAANFAKKIAMDSTNSFFVNFNYTMTLEKLYRIPSRDVWHIHGSLSSKEFEIGHGKSDEDISNDAASPIPPYNPYKDDPSDYGLDCIEDEITKNTRMCAVEQVKRIRKDVHGIIQRNQDKFLRFSDVKHLYLYGLSFSKVDLPYITEVLDIIPKNASISISYYNDTDKSRINDFMKNKNRIYNLVTL